MDVNKEGITDLMIHRMKNRERQRKYREWKRLQEEAEAEICGYADNFARRVYCSRDWKQDARSRKAHLMNITHRQRDWKAEARKMKN